MFGKMCTVVKIFAGFSLKKVISDLFIRLHHSFS